MDNPQEDNTNFSNTLRRFSTMALIGLIVVALTALPVKFDTKSKFFVSAVVLADDDGNDGGDGGGSKGSDGGDGGDEGSGDGGDHDGDDDGDHDGDDGDDDDDADDGADHDADDKDDDDAEDQNDDKSDDSKDKGKDKDSSASSKNEDKKSENNSKKDTASGLFSVGGLKGLSPVSPKDEESLVGNWGNSTGKTDAKASGSKSK